MKTSNALLGICLLFLFVQVTCRQAKSPDTELPKNTYLTTLRLNAEAGVTDAEVIAMVEKYSQAIIDQGYPHLTYKIWKLYEESPAKVQTYLIEGNWPDRKIWEEIHFHDTYKAVGESFAGKALVKDAEMVHYTLLKDQLK